MTMRRGPTPTGRTAVTEIELTPDAVRAVYQGLGGRGGAFADVLSQSRALIESGHTVRWSVPVLRATVHRLEALYLAACDVGARIALTHGETLSSAESGFLADFHRHGVTDERDAGRGLATQLTLAAEMANEAWHLAWALPRLMLSSTPVPIRGPLKRVLLIGAYGGDHVGDAAILGGVLLALEQRYGVTSAQLLSHRASHTQRLVDGLSTTVDVTVHHYEPTRSKALMADADALVIAGGPMMDLPRVLAKHLIVASEARRLHRPLIIERVGIGPFRRALSKRATGLLARQAASLSTRTQAAARSELLSGLDVTVGRDPAFDYLETRHELTRLTVEDRQSADAVLSGTEERVVVGINVRPLSHRRSTRGPEYSQRTEDAFVEQLADGMRRFANSSARPVSFVFFPMNPIQSGMSDLASAYRLFRLVGHELDFRVWEADPDVDGVLYFLRRVHAAITVRFHASIFALSQGIPTIGVDYFPGVGGKVLELFSDLQREDDARVMDALTAEWVAERLRAACG